MKQNYKKNVLGQPLKMCSCAPQTGYFRDGYCRTDTHDYGQHVICAEMTQAFLTFTAKKGNDLMTPRPEFNFPGLKAQDKWCLCALRWQEAWQAGLAPPVILEACEETVLKIIPLAILLEHAQQPLH